VGFPAFWVHVNDYSRNGEFHIHSLVQLANLIELSVLDAMTKSKDTILTKSLELFPLAEFASMMATEVFFLASDGWLRDLGQ